MRSLIRDQHGGFGAELRSLLGSKIKADRELAGIVINEIEALVAAKREGHAHPSEKTFTDISEIHYLSFRPYRYSVRVYFTCLKKLWLLHLDVGKRRTNVMKGTVEKLRSRLREVREQDK